MENNQRRDFLKKSILGLSGAALLPQALRASSPRHSALPALPVRTLGKTGLNVPLISMGTSGATNPGFIRSAYDAGIKLFFSATYYGQGNNEILVGEALKVLPRDSYTIGTACGADGLDQKTGTFTNGFDTDSYIKKAEASLKRFGTDHVDFLLFPYSGKREMVLHEGVLSAMQKLKQQGKVRFVGIASHDNIEEALKAAADSGVYDMAMPAYNYKTAGSTTMDEALAYAVKAGIGIIAMKTTAGAARSKNGPPLNTNAALKWVLKNENVSSIVSGMSSVEELQKNLAMINNLNMTDQEMKDLSLANVEAEPGLYCRQCKECLPQCPANLDIPTLMRGYMYAYGYHNLEHAYYTVADSGIAGNPCDICDVCKVNCSAGFNVQEKVRDIARLRDVPADFLRA
jgi:uncharacterized protein